jgi:hypothetical protein
VAARAYSISCVPWKLSVLQRQQACRHAPCFSRHWRRCQQHQQNHRRDTETALVRRRKGECPTTSADVLWSRGHREHSATHLIFRPACHAACASCLTATSATSAVSIQVGRPPVRNHSARALPSGLASTGLSLLLGAMSLRVQLRVLCKYRAMRTAVDAIACARFSARQFGLYLRRNVQRQRQHYPLHQFLRFDAQYISSYWLDSES